MIPRHPAVPAAIAATNGAHRTELDEYRGARIIKDQHLLPLSHRRLAGLLRTAAALLEDREHGQDPVVLADLYTFLRDAGRHLTVEAWAVVKHYAERDRDPSSVWAPAVWIGCTTEEQARAMAPAIGEHYAGKRRHIAVQDRWEVERRRVNITDMVDPAATPEQYVRGLG